MIALQLIKRVCICRFSVDFRKAHNGLMGSALAAGLNPQNGDLVVFVGKRRNRLKILFRDRNGYILLYKIFDQVAFRGHKFLDSPTTREISFGEVALLIEGTTKADGTP